MANDVGGAIEDAMTGAFRNAEDAFVSFVQTGKVDFSSLINSMIADLARAQFRQLTSSLFGGFNFGNIFGSLFGGGTASVPLPPIRPYAMGTDYAQGGLSLVGENGPELVRLPRGASVTPSHKLGGMGGTTINQNFTFTGGVTEKDLARILPEVSKAGANMALSQIAGGRLSARMA
jgi:phage-related minor tail protein